MNATGLQQMEHSITLCAWHHLRGIHAGRVPASGEVPDGITWEIGVRAARRPLLRVDACGYVGADRCYASFYDSSRRSQ